VIMLGSNNYLGLTGDERVKRAAIEAVERYGTGCTGSRLMNGTLSLHLELEDELADWMGTEAALVFTAGYLANMGLLSTLVEADDAVFLDSAGHASLIDGARLCNGVLRSFRHNLPSSLHQRLKTWRAKHPSGGALVAVDGIYSMEGDRAPVAEIAAVCAHHGARLLVDEAHALGVLGPSGRGLCAELGVEPDVLIGTLGKAFGSAGGFVTGSAALREYLINRARTFVFTTSAPPPVAAAAVAGIQLAAGPEGDLRRARLASNRRRLVASIQPHLTLPIISHAGPIPIIPLILGQDARALATARLLRARGIFVPAIRPPTVPVGTARLRLTLSSEHGDAEIDAAAAALTEALA
jgi:8-amino-7-oxononanoate synthase